MKVKSKQTIIEVYEDNFIYEIKRLGEYLKNYPYIGMDTEFPGIVYPLQVYSDDFYYKYIKQNIDKLKLIQLGVTLCNSKGETAPEGSTWQFNLKFNVEKDLHSNDSISMLSNSGIDFNLLKKKGIPHLIFAEYFLTSGLVLNEEITWISFNGLSDFGYLLRLCLNYDLPETVDNFINTLETYFPNYYDIKILVTVDENLKGGLNKLAQQLGVERIGEIHQAGSDSIVTAEVFFKLGFMNLISKEELFDRKNILFGIGKGADNNETYQYTMFANNVNLNNTMNINNNIPFTNNYGNYYNNNMNNINGNDEQMNYNPYLNNNNQYDDNRNSPYPYNMNMGYGNNQVFF